MLRRLASWLDTAGPGIGLLIIRVSMGLFWLGQLTWKPPPSFGCPNEGFCLWVQKEIQYPLIPLYASFLQTVIQPNIFFWGWFTTLVEVLIGLSLLLGILTRLGGLVSLLWSLNLLIGLAAVPNEYPPAYLLLALLGLLFLMLGAGERLNLDARLVRPWLARTPPSVWSALVDCAS